MPERCPNGSGRSPVTLKKGGEIVQNPENLSGIAQTYHSILMAPAPLTAYQNEFVSLFEDIQYNISPNRCQLGVLTGYISLGRVPVSCE